MPVLVGVLLVLLVGYIIGRVLGGVVTRVLQKVGLSKYIPESMQTRPGTVERSLGKLVSYYVYLITLLAAADILDIPGLSTLLNTFAGYIPALIGGLVIFVVGILVAEFVEELVVNAVEGRVGRVAGMAVKVFIYYIVVTLALSTIGFDTTVLTNLFTVFIAAFFGTLAIALAIGIGVGVGLGSKGYVAENIGTWVDTARNSVAEDDAPPE